MPHTLNTLIVAIEVGCNQAGALQTFPIYRKTVVLRSNIDASTLNFDYWVVSAMVAKFHF